MIKGAGAQLIGRACSPVPVENWPVFRSEDPLHACYELHDAVGGNPHNKYVHLKRCTSGPVRITTTMRLILEFACSLCVHATVSLGVSFPCVCYCMNKTFDSDRSAVIPETFPGIWKRLSYVLEEWKDH